MNPKPAAAFAAGLWIGAVVGAAIVSFYLRVWDRPRRDDLPRASVETTRDEEIQSLKQEQARLSAEAQRLRQTVADLKNDMETRSSPDTVPAARRVPFRAPVATTNDSSEAWIAEAVANGDTQALPRLEELASRNNETALEAVAALADRDNGAALARVWNSSSLSAVIRVKAAQLLAATLESNPHAVDFLQSLFSSSSTDVRLLYAVIEGIAKPGVDFPAPPGAPPAIRPSPQPNFDLRLQLLDSFAASVVDPGLRARIDQARDDLLSRWVQAEPAAQ